LYSPLDVQRILRIKALTEEMGVNLAGAEVVLRLMAQIKELQAENEGLKREIRRLKSRAVSARRTARRRVP
jgi:MerR family transcriptional regulator/heat shock protein HspR